MKEPTGSKWVHDGLIEFMRTVQEAPNRMAFCILFEEEEDGEAIASVIHTEARGSDLFLGTCIGKLASMHLDFLEKGMKGGKWTEETKMVVLLTGMQSILKREMKDANSDTPSSLSVGEDGSLKETTP